MKNAFDSDLEKYREELIRREERMAKIEIEEQHKRCVVYPIVVIVIGVVMWLFSLILCKMPILSTIIEAFELQFILYGTAIFCCAIGGAWLLLGMIDYAHIKKRIINNLDKKTKEWMNYVPDDLTLAMRGVINDHPELFPKRKLSSTEKATINYSGNSNLRQTNSSFSYEDEMREQEKRAFSYIDASGAYRKWGDDFIDCKGNWCTWGSGFYDFDGNYIRWGETYKDKSGAYRRWGDDFVDGADRYVKCPR